MRLRSDADCVPTQMRFDSPRSPAGDPQKLRRGYDAWPREAVGSSWGRYPREALARRSKFRRFGRLQLDRLDPRRSLVARVAVALLVLLSATIGAIYLAVVPSLLHRLVNRKLARLEAVVMGARLASRLTSSTGRQMRRTFLPSARFASLS